MSQQDNGVSVFTQLGLTKRQAEVYIAIAKLGQTTAKSIAQTLQIARAEVYRATAELQKLGLIKKIITTPTAFRAILPSEGLSILIQHKVEEHREIKKQAKQFLRNFNQNREKLNPENFRYFLTKGLKSESREFSRDYRAIRTCSNLIHFDWKHFLYWFNKHFEIIKKTLERGVKLRYIINIPEGEKIPQSIETLTEIGAFEIKSASAIPKAGIEIIDKKAVHLIIIPNGNYREIEVLRANNPAVAELAQDYFELKWQSATTLAGTRRPSNKKITQRF